MEVDRAWDDRTSAVVVGRRKSSSDLAVVVFVVRAGVVKSVLIRMFERSEVWVWVGIVGSSAPREPERARVREGGE